MGQENSKIDKTFEIKENSNIFENEQNIFNGFDIIADEQVYESFETETDNIKNDRNKIISQLKDTDLTKRVSHKQYELSKLNNKVLSLTKTKNDLELQIKNLEEKFNKYQYETSKMENKIRDLKFEQNKLLETQSEFKFNFNRQKKINVTSF